MTNEQPNHLELYADLSPKLSEGFRAAGLCPGLSPFLPRLFHMHSPQKTEVGGGTDKFGSLKGKCRNCGPGKALLVAPRQPQGTVTATMCPPSVERPSTGGCH